ncbi:MAG TPA: hypothetical protein PKH19_04255, partial [Candidatus Syntrophosphaera sp.]|nr:hypothetical protein [Candidatus Syntrophosphaera sp.]
TDPQLSLNASSPRISYKEFSAENLNLSADYSNDELSFSLPGARWDNQTVTLDGVFDVPQRRATAELVTQPVSLSRDELKIDAALTLELGLHSALPEAKVNFARLHLAKGDLDLPVLAGYMNLFPLITEKQKNYYVDLDLDDGNGTRLSLIGDILDRDLLLDAEFENLAPAELFPVSLLSQINPLLSGKISSFMAKDKLVVSSQLDLQLNGALNYQTSLELKGSYDLTAKEGTAILDAGPGSFNGQPLELELIAQLLDRDVILHSLRLNDQFNLQGDLALDDLADFSCELSLRDLNSAQLTSYFPFLKLPQLNGINLDASFNRDGDRHLDAKFRLEEFQVSGIRPLSLNLDLRGPPEQIAISGGIANQARRLVELSGALDIPEGVDLRLNAQAYDLQAADVIVSNLASGAADVDLSFAFTDILTSERDMSLLGQISSPEFSIPDVLDLSDILIRVAQTENVLIVDTLAVTSLQYGSVHGSGALDYNLFTNSFLEGEHLLDLNVEANMFDWLAANLDLVNAASGKARLNCSLKTYEDQLMVQAGRLDIAEGRLVLKDQPEPVRDINIQADFADNRVLLRNFSCLSGNGRLTVQNSFEEDDSEHLKLGFLDWGILSLRIDQPGALVQIPLVTTSRNLSNVVLQGQNSEYATIRGPLDDMRISAEVLVYNAEALFPPNTDNLLSLIYSFRSALSKPDIAPPDPVPLPFRLDLMIRMMDNIRYATYPTNFRMQPGGFLHIVYDGLNWHAREANFLSEQGSIDFFGTVFNTESLNIRIIEDQDLIDIKGSFTRRAADGTVITLSVNTDPDTAKPIFDRLTFSLTSDNPEDRTVSNILSRLRYSSSSEELSATQRGSLLQDE